MLLLATACFDPVDPTGDAGSGGEDDSSGGSSSGDESPVAGSSDATSSGEAVDESTDASTGDAPEADPPPPVALRWPWNGAATGSPWAVADDLAARPRRPTFRWTPSRGASEYRIQIDDDCSTPGFESCPFADPTIDVVVDQPSFTPPEDLPISETAPVGRRYYWRVRACDAGRCSDYSAIRYVDVARSARDFNGDGYADAALTAYLQDGPEVDEGAAFVYHGSPEGLADAPSRTLDNPDDQTGGAFGVLLATPGDLDADGFGDLVVSAYRQSQPEAAEGVAYVYLGGPEGIGSVPTIILDDPDDESEAQFGLGVRGIADANADGFADLVVAAPRSDASEVDGGAAYLFLGDATGVPTQPSAVLARPRAAVAPGFGETVGGGGDIDGDGYADALIGSYRGTGELFVYRGSPQGLGSEPDDLLTSPTGDLNGGFGTVGWIADLDGDDLGDALVGAYLQDGIGTDEGQLLVYFGDEAGFDDAPDQTIVNPVDQAGGRFAVSVVTGDADGDGALEVLVGADRQDNPESDEGAAFLYRTGSDGLQAEPSIVLDNPLDGADGHMGQVGVLGDIDGDGYCDFVASPWRQDNPEADEGNAGIYRGLAAGLDVGNPIILDNPSDQAGGHFGVPSRD